MKRYISKFAGMHAFRAAGRPRFFPISVAYSLTHRCNSRCATCGLGRGAAPAADELETAEWLRVFKSLGRAPVWITVTGGEPFMRQDLMDLCRGMVAAAQPKAVTFATNGYFTDRASLLLPLLAREYPDTRFVVNISLDGIGPAHDRLRGLSGSFEAATDTFHSLKRNKPRNLYLGFHTTVSRHNIDAVPDIIVYTREFEPDGHIFEMAQKREELHVSAEEHAPDVGRYEALIPRLVEAAKGHGALGTTKRARYAFRDGYYALAAEAVKEGKQPIPCFAGFASAQISPGGDVWACCVRGRSMGKLRDAAFDFAKVWRSGEADEIRESVRRGDCHCPMANAMLTSMMFNPSAAATVAGRFLESAAGDIFPARKDKK